MDPGHEVLRPRLNHDERLNDDGEPQQSESAVHRCHERTPPRRRSKARSGCRPTMSRLAPLLSKSLDMLRNPVSQKGLESNLLASHQSLT